MQQSAVRVGAETLSNKRKAANTDVTIYFKGADGLEPQFFRKWGVLTFMVYSLGFLESKVTYYQQMNLFHPLCVLRFSLVPSSLVFERYPLCKCQTKATLAKGRSRGVCVAAREGEHRHGSTKN